MLQQSGTALIAIYGAPLLLLSAVGAWAIGRMATRILSVESGATRAALYLGLTVMAVLVCVGPAISIAFFFFEDLNLEDLLNYLPPSALPLSGLVYTVVLYVSFRLGIGK